MRLRKNNVNHTKTQVRTHTQINIYFHVIVMFTIVVIVITYYVLLLLLCSRKKGSKMCEHFLWDVRVSFG